MELTLPECSFPGCVNVMKYKRDRLCAGHRTQVQRGKPLTPLKRPKTRKYCRKGDGNLIYGIDLCRDCYEKEYKHGLPLDMFERLAVKGKKAAAVLPAERVPQIPYVAPIPEEFKEAVRLKTARRPDSDLLNSILGI